MRPPSNHRDGASLLLLRWTRQFCLELDQPLPSTAQHIPIPPAIEHAVPRRQM